MPLVFKRRYALAVGALAVAAAIATQAFWPRTTDPDALWKIVHDRCVPAAQAGRDPKPCAEVDLSHGFALLKDIHGVAQYLLIPTARTTGIEDAALRQPGAPPYFAEAWAERTWLEKALGRDLPPQDIGLAINSRYGRSQNQLHIHIDCVRPDIRDAVRVHLSEVIREWTPFPVKLLDHTYRARRVDALEGNDPIALVASGIPGATDNMARETLVALGETFPDGATGFVLLDDEAAGSDKAHGEELLDHSCAVAHEVGP
jgi:CDP-diacylglycerol pyrophosphatase